MKHKILIFLFSCLATWAFAQPVTRVRLITLQDPPDTTVQYFIQAGGGKDTIKYVPVDTILASALSGSGTSPEIAYWDGASSLTSNSNFSYDASKSILSITDANSNVNLGKYAGRYMSATGDRNTLVGYQAGESTSGTTIQGDNNVMVGYQAGNTLSTGLQNTGIGTQALKALTTGQNNIAIGYQAGQSLGIGSSNIFIGSNAGNAVTGTSSHIFIGNNAGSRVTNGVANTFYGHNSGQAVTLGSYNTAVGNSAMGNSSGTTGATSVAIGYQAMNAFSATGQANVGVGYQALQSGTSARFNVGIGYQAGQATSIGIYNLFIGYQAGQSGDATASYAIGIGPGALDNTTQKDNCIAIGYQAGLSNSRNNAILIGRSVTASANNQIVIGNSTYHDHARFPLTGHLKVPDGTTAQQVTGEDGAFRYNTTENLYSGYGNGAWTFFPYMDNSLAQMTANNFVVNADQSTTNLGGLGLIYNDVNNEWEGAERAHAVLYNGTMDSIITTGSTDYDIITGWNTAGEKSSHWTLTDTSAIYDNCTGACPAIVVKVHMELSVRASSAGNHVFQLGYATTTGVATFTIPQGAAETQYLRASPDVTQVVREIQFEIQDGYEIKSRGGGVNGGIGIPDGGITITQVN